MPRSTNTRIEFTTEHDLYLARYLAKYSATKENRSGNKLFKDLVENTRNKWPWSVHHTWQSWRQRYVKNQSDFDVRIAKYQAKDKLPTGQKRKKAASSASIEMAGPSTKRVKLKPNKEQERGGKGEGSSGHTNTQPSSKPTSASTHEPDVQPYTPQRPSTKNADTLESPSSSPTRQAAPTDAVAKQFKKRWRVPSEVFASEPSSPTKIPGPSSQTRPAPSGPVSTYPRAPPRFVNSFDGQVLVDRKGRVPRAFPLENAEEEEEEEDMVEDKVQWPPLRHEAAKQKTANGEVNKHHAFSQPQPPLPPEEDADGERRHPFELDRRALVAQFIADARVENEHGKDAVRSGPSPVKRTVPPALEPHTSPGPKSPSKVPPEESTSEGEQGRPHALETDRRVVAAQLIGDVPVESERREDAAVNGTSPAKRTVLPPPELLTGPAPKLSKTPKFPAPRASTASPFGPESPTKEVRPPQPQPRAPRTKAPRHPALARIQRQGENGREEVHVPDVDFVALSRSSASAQSSRSSGTSVRQPRWSLPAFSRVPWVDENGASSATGSRSGSGSGSGVASPFRWRLPVYGERDRLGRASMPFAPSPARSLTAVATDGSTNGPVASPAFTRMPLHPTDVDLVCSHGLASFLTHMAANHGLALSVVEEVYERIGSLAVADEVLKGMREAAQGFGEREIERRLRGEGVQMHVEEDDDEYSPPETSRAAMWKRREMQRAEEVEEEEELEDEQHDFSRHGMGVEAHDEEAATADALMEHLGAQALQRRMGRSQFRRDIVKRFV